MRNTFISSGLLRRSDTSSSTESATPGTDVDEVNGDSDKAKLLRMSGQIDTNEFTIQGAHGPQSEARVREEKQKYEDRRRAFAQIFSNPFIADCVAAFLRATPHYNHGLSPEEVAAAEQKTEQSLEDQYKIEEIKVSDEAHTVIAEETKTLEDYIAEYEAATDPAEKAQLEMELRTYAKYLDVEIDFDAKDGPSILGYHEHRINELERFFHGNNFVPSDSCTMQVCVLREIEHGQNGGLKNKTAPEMKAADDVDDIVGNKATAPVVTTPAPPPVLNLQ